MVAIFYVEFTKKKLFSLFLLLNFSFKKIHKHPACKMNRGEQGGAGQKFEVLCEHTFLNDCKVFLLHLRSTF